MSQHDHVIDSASGAAVRADLNNALGAIATQNSGSSAPSTTYAYMRWMDTTTGVIKRRNAANSGWLVEGTLDETFVISRSSNTMFDVSDKTKVYRITGSYTQTFDAVATLGDGWWVGFRVESGATLTFDPNSTETIDGATTLAIVGPASGFVYCNGSALHTFGLSGAATQAEQEAGTSAIKFVTPSTQQYHPSALKGWVMADTAGSAAASYNLTSLTDNGAGDVTANWNVDFSGAAYWAMACPRNTPGGSAASTLISNVADLSFAAGTTRVVTVRASDWAGTDPSYTFIAVAGDQ